MEPSPPTLILWGDTQVGKTTLLATTLAEPADTLPAIDRHRSAKALATLFPEMQRLRKQQPARPTSVSYIDLELECRNDRRVRIRDVQGGLTRVLHEDHTMERLGDARAVLFVVEWKARDIEHQLNAIRGAWNLCSHAHRGLVFTKCEMTLEQEDDAWNAGAGWWRIDEGLRPYANVVERFGPAVWPTSCFGYDQHTGYPAVVLGEFGQLLPFRIQPLKVERPFQWAFERMGIA